MTGHAISVDVMEVDSMIYRMPEPQGGSVHHGNCQDARARMFPRTRGVSLLEAPKKLDHSRLCVVEAAHTVYSCSDERRDNRGRTGWRNFYLRL